MTNQKLLSMVRAHDIQYHTKLYVTSSKNEAHTNREAADVE